MATYRVYLARPKTQPPVWDWSQTVVATAPNIALERSYADWQESHPNPPPPPLNECRSQVNAIKAMQESEADSEGQQQGQ